MGEIGLNIYNFVVNVIGPVPTEMEFIYAIGVIIVLLIIVLMVYLPWAYLFGKR